MKKAILSLLALTALGLGIAIYTGKVSFFGGKNSNNEAYLEEKAELLREENTDIAPRQSFCGNAYLPFVPGANWTYTVSDGTNNDVLKLTIAEPEGENYFIDGKLSSSDWTFRHPIKCADGKISMNYFNFSHPFQTIYTYTTPLESEGFFIPRDISSGEISFWNVRIKNSNETVDPEKNMAIVASNTEEDNISLQVSGIENVSSVIGNIPAIRLKSSWIIKRTPGVDGKEEKKNASLDIWLGNQIGIVRSVYGEDGVPPTILEIRGYQIPAARTADSSNKGVESNTIPPE